MTAAAPAAKALEETITGAAIIAEASMLRVRPEMKSVATTVAPTTQTAEAVAEAADAASPAVACAEEAAQMTTVAKVAEPAAKRATEVAAAKAAAAVATLRANVKKMMLITKKTVAAQRATDSLPVQVQLHLVQSPYRLQLRD